MSTQTVTAATVTEPVRILYPLGSLNVNTDGTYAVEYTATPATMYRGSQGIFVKVDSSPRNDDTYRVLPTDTFDVA
jgi:hypothetical protein